MSSPSSIVFLDKIPPYAKRKIDEVAVDPNQGYKNAIKKAFPQLRVVADPFHLGIIDKKLDDERKQERRFTLSLKEKE